MNIMKETYDFWLRVIVELESVIESKETEIIINTAFLKEAKSRMAQFKKPKSDSNPLVK